VSESDDALSEGMRIGVAWIRLRAAIPDRALITMRQREGGSIEVYVQDAVAHRSLGYAYGANEIEALEGMIARVENPVLGMARP
jgi:hypothetical protein